MGIGVVGLIVLAVLIGVSFARHGDSPARSRFLRRLGFGLSAVFGGFAALFIAGETLSDPGGWAGAGLVALWAVPMAGLAALAWYRPDVATRVLLVLVGAVVALSMWYAVAPESWRSFEDDHGPVRAIVTFALAGVLAVYGLKRTGTAGVLLLVVGIAPPVLATFGARGSMSLAAVSTVPVITGALYLLSAAVEHGSTPSVAGGAPTPRPKAA